MGIDAMKRLSSSSYCEFDAGAKLSVQRLLVDLRSDGRVQVLSWPAGEQYPRPVGDPVELVWPLTDDDLTDLRWYLEQYLEVPSGVYEERGARVAGLLPSWGEQIFTAVFPAGPVRDAYVNARAQDSPAELVFLSSSAQQLGRPWELMSFPGRSVPVVLDGVAVSRNLTGAGMAKVVDVPGSRLRVLMVISRPQGTNDVGYQMIARPLLRRLEAVRGSVDLVVLRPPTLDRLREVLTEAQEAGKPFQVVHFDGHGVFGQTSATGAGGGWGPVMYDAPGPQGMLAFEKPGGGSDLVDAGRVAQVLAGAKVPVVVLNACQSGQLETQGGSQVEAAVATRLLTEGCASVVAMAYSVFAVAAAEFMTAFYERLFAGDRVTDAVAAGRAQLKLNDKRPSLKGMLPLADWMVPVLYTRSEAHFPDLRTAREPAPDVGDILTRIRQEPSTGQGHGLEPVGEFVGRDADFYTLDTAARLQHVVVVHGPGGTGKTELAKAFGRWWRDTGGVEKPEWVLWHSFEPGVASFGLDGVITDIGLQIFGNQFALLDDAKRQAAVEELLTTRKLLLIWDNFESVREMPDPGRATPPLPQHEQDRMRDFLSRIAAGSGSAVVITSRTPETWLGLDVRRIPLGGLTGKDATAYADQILAPYPAAGPHRQTKAFADLMQWLDGHPLSMRLTLPHLETSTAQHLLSGLQGTTALPVEGDGGTDGDRSTSLSASIAYSFRHLSRDDQEALTILSLFHGVAFTTVLGAFSSLPETPERYRGRTEQDWAELLKRSADLGLLTPLKAGMFRLHPALPTHLAAHWRTSTLSAHPYEQAAALQALVLAHAGFGAWLSSQTRSSGAQSAFTLVRYQQRMLGAMLGHALADGQWGQAQAIMQPLDDFWDMAAQAREAESWVDRVRLAVESPDGTPPDVGTPAGGLWMFTVGTHANRQAAAGQLDDAERAHLTILQALVHQESSPHHSYLMAVSYHQLGMVAQDRGRLDEAGDWCRKSLAIHEGLRDGPGMAANYHHLGTMAEEGWRWDEAEEWHRKSLAIKEGLGDGPGMAASYLQLGTVAKGRQRLDEAEDWYRKSLAIHEGLRDGRGMATSYHQLGMVAHNRERLDDAEKWYRKSLAIEEGLGSGPGLASSYHQLGMVAQDRGRWDEAEEWYRKSLVIREGLGDGPSAAASYHQLGMVAQDRGRWDEAEEWYTKSLVIEEDLRNGPGMAASCHQLGMVAQDRGRLDEAEEWHTKSLVIREGIEDGRGMASSCHQLGIVAQDRGRWDEAEEWYRKSLAIKEDLGNRPGMAITYAQLGLFAGARDDADNALTWVIKCLALFDEIPHPRAGSGPQHLRLLTAHLGIQAVERAWQQQTGNPLPPAVRAYAITPPTDTDTDAEELPS
ncbi:CHAT domain-containing tetratricopeptide repeat protein [Streptomyces cyaneofuscatus]|uniref:CHAT domain-containing tetratricopeptide repeat protein n=1 Tax=Streptomyces cyaneofuscatus TaxID=66883 RepID=UPI0036CA7135